MDYRIKLLKGKYQRDGLPRVVLSIAHLLIRKMSPLEMRADWKRRRLGKSLYVDFNGEIRYGAFTGLRIPKKLIWAKNDMPSILIGFYEKQVVDWITSRQIHFSYLIDIGSADGLYLAGILKANFADSAVGFESSRRGRESSNQILRVNNVLDRAIVMGTANSEILNSVLELHTSNIQEYSLLICDIEGGEVDLFDSQTALRLHNFFIVVELHEWTYSTNQSTELINLFKSTHDVQFLYSSGRNPDSIPELQKLTDDERWNICSEGRRETMRWLVCTPLGF